MPKATKKKKEKQADLTKAKLKLGKGKKLASNATDTSFKARSIALPGQSNLNRAVTDASEPVTNAGLTLDEVLLRFRHPNTGVRKDSLSGLRDILNAGVERETGKVVRAIGGLVSDEDAGVRKALLGFLGWYIPNIPTTSLTPHLPLLLLQTSSALAHIYPEIRLDAAKLISLLLSHVPSQVVGSWPHASSSKSTLDNGEGILQGLRFAVGLGGETGTAAALGKIGLSGRLTSLSTLLEFVKVALRDVEVEAGNVSGSWSRAPQIGGNARGKGKGKEVMVSPEVVMPYGWILNEGDWGLVSDCWEIGQIGTEEADDQDAGNRALTELYLQLSPLLLSTFLEAAPTAFSPSSAPLSTIEIPISLCLVTASLTLTLTRPLLQSSSSSEVKLAVNEFTRRMAPYFPFNAPSAPSPTGLTPSLELNLAYSNLTLLLVPSLPDIQFGKHRKEPGWRERVKAIEEVWRVAREREGREKGKKKVDARALEEVADWLVEILSPSKDVLAPSLTATTYTSILPIVQSLLLQPPSPHDDVPSKTGQAVLSHLLRQSSSSTIRSQGDKFVISLISAHEDRHSTIPFYIPPSSPVRKLLASWIGTIPKTLWELGTKDLDATISLIDWLRTIALHGRNSIQPPLSLLSGTSFEDMAGRLGVWFHLVHPSKGSTLGPWAKFTSFEVRKAGLDMALAWTTYDRNGGLMNAVNTAVGRLGGPDLAYWKARTLSG